MTIIEADGVATQPLQVDFIQIWPGQRYSFILEANQSVNNYWIRAEQQEGIDGGSSGFAGGINSAILRYSGAPNGDPTTNQTQSVIPLNEANLHPLLNPAAPGEPHAGGADVQLNLEFNLDNFRFSINNVSYNPPTVPVLLQILSGAKTAADLLPTGSIYVLPPNQVIEISMPDNAESGTVSGRRFCRQIPGLNVPVLASHASTRSEFHFLPSFWYHLYLLLLQHAFSVVRTAGSSDYNYVNPVRRDVVSVGQPGDNVTIRFVTDNTGPWFLHW